MSRVDQSAAQPGLDGAVGDLSAEDAAEVQLVRDAQADQWRIEGDARALSELQSEWRRYAQAHRAIDQWGQQAGVRVQLRYVFSAQLQGHLDQATQYAARIRQGTARAREARAELSTQCGKAHSQVVRAGFSSRYLAHRLGISIQTIDKFMLDPTEMSLWRVDRIKVTQGSVFTPPEIGTGRTEGRGGRK